MTLDELIAREDIRRVMALYNTSGDSGRREEFATVFTEDAVLEAPGLHFTGRDAIVSGLFSGEVTAKFVRHHLSTSTISFKSPDLARGRTYFQVITQVGLDHSGVYTDWFRPEAGDWKIAHRIVSIDFASSESVFFPDGLSRD